MYVRRVPRRFYPNRELAATVVGHAGRSGKGLDGAELAFDKYLRGQPVVLKAERDALGRQMLVEGVQDASDATGHDVLLSLDSYLTFAAQRVLQETVDKHNAKSGSAVVMNPKTGEVLAIANVPTYDPNTPGQALQVGARNRVVTDIYEPGSTMKAFVVAAALADGVVSFDDEIYCENGLWKLGAQKVRDSHKYKKLSVAEVFQHSSNIGTAKIALRVGKEAIYKTFTDFGFGQKSYLGLPGEHRGLLRRPERWREIDFVTIAFGQGIAATPLQVTAAYSALANDGVYLAPRLALATVSPDGTRNALPLHPKAPNQKRVVSSQVAKGMLQVMELVTQKEARPPRLPFLVIGLVAKPARRRKWSMANTVRRNTWRLSLELFPRMTRGW